MLMKRILSLIILVNVSLILCASITIGRFKIDINANTEVPLVIENGEIQMTWQSTDPQETIEFSIIGNQAEFRNYGDFYSGRSSGILYIIPLREGEFTLKVKIRDKNYNVTHE